MTEVTEVAEVVEVRGFIVSAWEEPRREAATRRLLATGRLDDGRSFALVLPAPTPALYVAEPDGPRTLALLSSQDARLDALPWADLAGETLARVELRKGSPEDAVRRLAAAGLVTRGLERAGASDALLALGLTGPALIRGVPKPGQRVDVVFVDPEVSPSPSPSTTVPPLAWLALDIETDRAGAVVAASLAGPRGPGEVHYVGPLPSSVVVSHPSEKGRLEQSRGCAR